MAEFLSQEEVDALIKGLGNGDVPVGEATIAEHPDVVPYDFSNIQFLPRKAPPALDLIHDRFSTLAGQALSRTFKKDVDVRVAGSRVTRFDSFLAGVRVPGSLFTVFRLPSLALYGMVTLDSQLLFPLLESLLGGKGISRTKLEGRDFSKLESRLINRMSEALLREYGEAWRSMQHSGAEVLGSETNPRYLTMFPGSEVIIITSFGVDTHYARGDFLVCLPYVISDKLKQLAAQPLSAQHEEKERLELGLAQVVGGLRVEVTAVLGHTHIPVEKVMGLAEGDVLPLDTGVDGTVVLLVEGREKFAGFLGASGGRKSVRIQSVLVVPESQD